MKILTIALLFILSLGWTPVSAAGEKTGVVSICFDDAQQNVFPLAFPILQAHGLPATLYVITAGIQEKPSWHMSWGEIKAVAQAKWEIGSHSHSHLALNTLSPEMIEEELLLSKKILLEHGLKPESLASPYGEYDDRVIDTAKKHYNSHRGVEKVRGRPELCLNEKDIDPYHISAIQLHYDYSIGLIKTWIDQAASEGKWAVFYLHGITNERPNPGDYLFDASKLAELAAYLAKLQDEGKLKILTVSDHLNSMGGK